MINFVRGIDAYRVKERVDELVSTSEKKGFVLSKFDLNEKSEFNRLVSAIKTVGLFANNEILVLTNAFGPNSAATVALLKDYKVADDEARHVIVSSTDTDVAHKKADKELFNLLNTKKVESENLKPLNDTELISWVKEQAQKRGSSMENSTARKLIDYVIDNSNTFGKAGDGSAKNKTWRLQNEIAKLSNYSKGNTIQESDVKELIDPTSGVGIFAITDSLATRNRAQATVLISRSLDSGADPYYLFTMIIYQFRNLLTIKSLVKNAASSNAIATVTKLHPYVIQKTSAQSRAFELSELKDYFTQLHDLERNHKNGKIDLVDGIYNFVFSL